MRQIYHSQEEIDSDLDVIKKEALLNYNKAVKIDRNHRKKKWIQISMIVIIVIIIFKCTIGMLELTNPFAYNKNRLYEVKLNNTLVTVNATDRHRIPLIPYFIYLNTYHTTIYYGMDDPHQITGADNKYILDVKSYKCYSKNTKTPIGCSSTDNYLVKKSVMDTTYTNLYIRKNGKPERVMYNGKMLDDISPYIQEKGYYYIQITAQYKNVTTNITFQLTNQHSS